MYAAELHQHCTLRVVILCGNWYEIVGSVYQMTSHTSCSIG